MPEYSNWLHYKQELPWDAAIKHVATGCLFQPRVSDQRRFAVNPAITEVLARRPGREDWNGGGDPGLSDLQLRVQPRELSGAAAKLIHLSRGGTNYAEGKLRFGFPWMQTRLTAALASLSQNVQFGSELTFSDLLKKF